MNHLTGLLTFTSVTALLVGSLAIARPVKLLESKGATVSPAAIIWTREVGVLIFAQGVTFALLRGESLSPALRAVLFGAGVTQLGLLPIELSAYLSGSLTRLSGIVPNSVLHALLGGALLYCALT
jgi:hypothetical protein